jgi:PAS domain S-box-containing protein
MKPNVSFERAIRVVSGICVGAAGLIAFLMLLAWITGQWTPGVLIHQRVPMAPTTAGAILLLSLSLFASIHRPNGDRTIRLCWISAACTIALTTFALALNVLLTTSRWVALPVTELAGTPVGVMSPLTAVILLLTAAALFLEVPPLGRRRAYRQTASAFGLIAGLISSWVVLGYVLGTPVLYGTSFVPMALSSGIALGLLSVGLVYHAAPGVWPISILLSGDSEEPSKWTAKGPIVAFSLLFASVAVVGGAYFAMQQASVRRAAQAELNAVADLKLEEIEYWYTERLADTRFFANAEFVARDVQDLLTGTDPDRAAARVLNWLRLLKGGERYARVSIFDAEGRVRLEIPQQTDPPGGKIRPLAAQTAQKNTTTLTDSREGNVNGPHVDIMFPIHAPGADPAVAAPIAVIGLRADLARFLFPIIQKWPTTSATAEILIVRREGNEVLYLNKPRYWKGSPGRLRLPIDQPNLPEAMAIQGRKGVVEGVDYRGVPVVAVLRQVQASQWFTVAKMDQSEIYAASRRQALHMAAVMVLLILAAGLGIVALWRQQNMEYFRAILEQEKRQGVLAQRFEHLMRQANDLILLTNKEGTILEANDRAVQTYARPVSELRETGLSGLCAPEARDAFDRQMAELAENGSIRFETAQQRPDGSAFPVEVSARLVDIGDTEHRLFIAHDITARKEREKEIERLNRLYAALSHINQAIVRSQARAEMLDGVCAALVEHGALQLARICRCDPQTQSISVCAGRGTDGETLSEADFPADNRATGWNSDINTALCENRPVVGRDLAVAPNSREAQFADHTGISASATLPIRHGGNIWGVLVVGAKDADYFGDREMALLQEAVDDVSFALDHLAGEAERRRAEDELRETQQRLSLAVEGARLGLWDWDLRTNAVHFSREYRRQLGYDDGEFSGTFNRWEENLHPDDREWTLATIAEFISKRGQYQEMEFRLRHRNGSYRWILSRAVLQCGRDGAPERMIGCHIDITDRKHSEEALRRSRENLLLAERIAHVGYWERPIDRAAIQWSDEAYRVFGLEPQNQPLDLPAFLLMVHPEDRHAVSEAIRATQEEDKPYNIEYRIMRADGTIRFVHAQGELFLDALGRPDRMFGTMLDITERRRAEEELRETQERLSLTLESSGVGTFDWRISEGKQVWDDNIRRLLGIDPDNYADMKANFMAAVHPEDRDRIFAELMHTMRNQSEIEIEFRVIWRDGGVHDISVRGRVHRDVSGRAVRMTGVCWDITARKEAESILKAYSDRLGRVIEEKTQQLREAQDELVRKGKLAVLGQLAGGVGHELRNPLGVISNAVYFLQLTSNERDETSREYLNIISTEVHNSQKIVSDLLGFARTGRADRSAVALSVLVAEVLAQVSPSKDVEICVNIPEDLPLLSVDPGQIRQVLSNIVLNACQAMQGGGSLTLGARCEGGRVWVSITDTGCGMSGEELSRIFEPLYSTKARGIGLGLSVTKNLVEANEGCIEAESEPGRGSTFTVVLPAQE